AATTKRRGPPAFHGIPPHRQSFRVSSSWSSSLEEVLSPADGAAGRTQDPQDGTDEDEDAADRGQQTHANKQADNQQNKSEDDHF
ncbi:hypothetical protein, partial [Streptomyces sp. NPDC055886]